MAEDPAVGVIVTEMATEGATVLNISPPIWRREQGYSLHGAHCLQEIAHGHFNMAMEGMREGYHAGGAGWAGSEGGGYGDSYYGRTTGGGIGRG